MEENELSQRYKTLPLDDIDAEFMGRKVVSEWNIANRERSDFLKRREGWLASWRSLTPNPKDGPWENSANFHVPIQLTFGKSIHSRLWQMFSDQRGMYGVMARRTAFKDKQDSVKEFMDFVLSSWANNKTGTRDTFDDMLWDMVFDGSGYLKLGWNRYVHQYLDVEEALETEETLVFDRENLTGRSDLKQKVVEEEVVKEEIVETPAISAIPIEDVVLPVGYSDPQTAPMVANRVFLEDYEMKQYARDGVFDPDAVEEVMPHKSSVHRGSDVTTAIKEARRQMDGNQDSESGEMSYKYPVIEWMGLAYVVKEKKGDEEQDMTKYPQQIVAWAHEVTGKLLGWTYLYRISPSGIRPLFKFDFIRFPRRSNGVGAPEVVDDISRNVDAMYNLRVNNGSIASMPMGVYRSTSGLKADIISVKPGTLYPVDDINDIRMMQFPYLSGFGEREEQNLMGMANRLLNTDDLQMGLAPQKVGALRNATGSNLIASESGIQFEIHYDRLARSMNKFLQALFRLCRQRMPAELYYRVTGELGEPIFGKIDKRSLKGEFDFIINVDVLGQSRLEQQQQATLAMQTLASPMFTTTGIVQPKNLYALAKNYLKAHKFSRVDEYLTPPVDYTGETLTTQERIYRVTVGRLDNLVQSIQLGENHEQAVKEIEAFKASDYMGLLETPVQIRTLNEIQARHMELMQAASGAPGLMNMAGVQIPQGGLQPVEPSLGGGGETLQAQQTAQGVGTPNGPMV